MPEGADMARFKALTPNLSTPKNAAKKLMLGLRFGRRADILATLHATTPDEQRVAIAMADMAEATGRLGEAAEKRFGPKEASLLTGTAVELAGALDQIETSTQTGDGKTVTLVPRVNGEKLTRVAVGDEWKVPLSNLAATADLDALKRQIRVVELQTHGLQEVTIELEQGHYKDMAALARGIEGKSLVAASDATRPPQDATSTTAMSPATTAPSK